MKLNPLQGILLATMILAVIGGTIGELNNYVTTQDLSALGQYGIYLKLLMTGTPVLVFAIWIYNIWMYIRQNQIAAVNQLIEQYDLNKLVQTIALFTGIIGPIVAFLPQYKEIGALVVVIGTALAKEIQNVLSGQNITQTNAQVASPTATSTVGLVTANMSLGTYKSWTVTIVNWMLTVIPPANLVSRYGQSQSPGSVQGYTSSDAFAQATKYIDGLLSLPAPGPPSASPVTPPT